MNSVGIDISKGRSTVAVMRPFGEVVTSPFEVRHTDSELSKLARQLKSLDGTAAAPGGEPGAAAVLWCVVLKRIGFIHKNRTVCGKITPPAFPCRFRGCGCAGRI